MREAGGVRRNRNRIPKTSIEKSCNAIIIFVKDCGFPIEYEWQLVGYDDHVHFMASLVIA